MDRNNIINALNVYDGSQPSLEKTVSVLSEEVGPDWMDKAFEELGDLPVELKEKLDHVFNYYASLMAWQEAQSYINQEEPLDVQMMDERLPVLKHWLDFFGQPGQDLYQQLENRCKQEQEATEPLPDDSDGQNDLQEVSDAFMQNEDASQDSRVKEDESSDSEGDIIFSEDGVTNEPLSNNENTAADNQSPKTQDTNFEIAIEEEPPSQNNTMPGNDTPEGFAIHKAEKEIVLLDNLQSWLAARCLQLGNIETFAYPYYGMVVDLMRQVVKDIQAVLDLENQGDIAQYYAKGLEALKRKKQAIEADIQTAVENCESNTTALIEEGMDLNKVKKALGDLDESTEKEYLGPAPDGFELLDDKPIDEEAVKEQYEQLEEKTQKEVEEKDISVVDEKKTSQNEQNGVQRKLSFSLKPKKG